MSETRKIALDLNKKGISCVPTGEGKRSKVSWKEYQDNLISNDEIDSFFIGDEGIAIIGGEVQCFDFDEKYRKGIYEDFVFCAAELGLSETLNKLVLQRTPSGGYHLVFRSANPFRNIKLANNGEGEAVIETRGEGGYFLIAPSEGYELLRGSFDEIPLITLEEREELLDLAKSFDMMPTPKMAEYVPTFKQSDGVLSPGDDYDARGDFFGLLNRHGWTSWGKCDMWTRPGKKRGVSATFGRIPGRFYVFSTSTALESGHVYKPWHVYTVLEHGGDFSRAIVELGRMGYGDKKYKKPKPASEYMANALEVMNAALSKGPEMSTKAASSDATIEEVGDEEDEEIRAKLLEVAFDKAKPPKEEPCIYKLAGVEIAHPGNLVALTAQIKSGKSSFASALLAAPMSKGSGDLLALQSLNEEGKGVLHFDTEQSPMDHYKMINRSLRRAGIEDAPEWFNSYCLTSWDYDSITIALISELKRLQRAHGGIHSVHLDGIADMVTSPNDETEANRFLNKLHGLAIAYHCPIFCVIHLNPGSSKTRGHLGSQLGRKAETVLALEKDEDEVITVFTSASRGQGISQKNGPRFEWSTKDNMHTLVQGSYSQDLAQSRAVTKKAGLSQLAWQAYNNDTGRQMAYKDLTDAVARLARVSDSTAKRKINEMIKYQIIQKSTADHLYMLGVISEAQSKLMP